MQTNTPRRWRTSTNPDLRLEGLRQIRKRVDLRSSTIASVRQTVSVRGSDRRGRFAPSGLLALWRYARPWLASSSRGHIATPVLDAVHAAHGS